MTKGILGALASIILMAVFVGVISSNLNGHSHQMVVDADSFKAMIEYQKETSQGNWTSGATN